MEQSDYSVQIDNDLRPMFYDEFQCIGGACQVSCCKGGWQITFSKKDYTAMKKLKLSPETQEKMDKTLKRVRNDSTDLNYAKFEQVNCSCPLLTDEDLCALQLDAGAKALPRVCSIYPRAERYADTGFYEKSLTLSCEAVLELLRKHPEGIIFLSDPIKKSMTKHFQEKLPLIPYAHDIRSVCIDILQCRKISLNRRIIFMGMRLEELMKEDVDVPQWIAETLAVLQSDHIVAIADRLSTGGSEVKKLFLIDNMKTLTRLCRETADPNIAGLKDRIAAGLGVEVDRSEAITVNIDAYIQTEKAFEETFAGSEYFFENLAVAVFFYLDLPQLKQTEELWKSYVNFCRIISFYRFMAAASMVTELDKLSYAPQWEAPKKGTWEMLIRLLCFANRELLHNSKRSDEMRDRYFENDSATLAHMAILLSE